MPTHTHRERERANKRELNKGGWKQELIEKIYMFEYAI
jgi:hypothetical protein